MQIINNIFAIAHKLTGIAKEVYDIYISSTISSACLMLIIIIMILTSIKKDGGFSRPFKVAISMLAVIIMQLFMVVYIISLVMN